MLLAEKGRLRYFGAKKSHMIMSSNPNQLPYLRTLQTLFVSLLVGQIGIFVVLWLFVKPSATPGFYRNPEDMPLIGVWVLAQAMAFFMVPRRIEAARSVTGITEKLTAYRAASIMRFALVEGAVLICLIGYFFMSANYALLTLAGVGVAIFVTFFPSRNRVINDLDLSPNEEAKLDES